MAEPTTYDWPTAEHRYWWMECKPKRKSWRVCVEYHADEFGEFVQPIDDNNCFTKGAMASMNARFIPCTSPPEFPPRTVWKHSS